MLEFVKGDFFDFDADIRINTVNCVGVMGAGVALAFKNKYPDMFKDYVKQCKAKKITPGNPSVWIEGDMFSKGVEIINFPTKNDWRNPSEYEYIESGLIWLSNYLKNREGLIVTLPALGCGHGGLDWEKVKQLIQKYLKATSNRILVFEPKASRKVSENELNSPKKVIKLEALGVKILSKKESLYPSGLTRYTEKNLYLLGNLITEFDIAIISSTNPSETEQLIIRKLIEYCQINSYSLLFGGSAFDKKMASFAMKKGIRTGVFLPSGIYISAEKMHAQVEEVSISILSIGDPFKSFNKKEYIPSVLSRMFISKFVVFTTDKLKWLEKHNKIISKNGIVSYFTTYKELSNEDYLAAININAKPIKITADDCVFFDFDVEQRI